jgi:predicted Zn-dependent protease
MTAKSCRQRLGIALAAASLTLAASVRHGGAAGFQDQQTGLRQVRALDDAGKYDQAVVQWRQLLRKFPGLPEAQLGLANDLALLNLCEEADSNDSPAGRPADEQEVVACICYYRRNDMPAAIRHLDAAAKLVRDNQEAAIFLGRSYAASGRPEEGIRVLKAYQAAQGQKADTLYWIGAFYDQLAEQVYETLAKAHPDSYLVLEMRGDQFLQQQKYDQALSAYSKALNLAPYAPGLHFDLGNTYWRMEKLDQAASALEAELKSNPNHTQANFELGDIEVKQGHAEEGVSLLQRAVALNPSLTEAHRSLGRAFLAEQRYSDALRELSIVVEAEPSDHTVHAMLAGLYQRMGDGRKASEESQRSNELIKQQMTDLQRKEAEQNQAASGLRSGPGK